MSFANDTDSPVTRTTPYAVRVSDSRLAGDAPGLPPMKPLDPPTVPFALGGMAVWALVGIGLLIFAPDREDWLWICLAGFLLGFPGLATMIVHDRHRRARLAAE
jgi:hypothetical protein